MTPGGGAGIPRGRRQANLLTDAEAFNMLRKVNNQMKAQAAFDSKLKERFGTVIDYFTSSRRKAQPPETL